MTRNRPSYTAVAASPMPPSLGLDSSSAKDTSESSSPIRKTLPQSAGCHVGRRWPERDRNRAVENIGKLFSLAKEFDIPLFVSPHYYFPHDHKWEFEGALERLMHDIKMFDRPGPLDTTGIDGSGADWLEQYKPLINDGQTVVCSPHKVYGPQSNDLVLQLRKRRIEQVILAGMPANLCVESHLREMLEQGFEVVVVGDATAAAQIPGYDGYEAAITNFRFLASDLWSTSEAAERLSELN